VEKLKSGLSLGFRFKEGGGGEEMVIGEAVRRKEIKYLKMSK
jgi:hypothetical protein